jgi:NADH-quinone oxidoreductase subunit C
VTKEELRNKINQQLPDFKMEESCDFLILFVAKDKIVDISAWLKDDRDTLFDMLSCETAVDRKTHFEMVYHLTSTIYRHNLVIKVLLEDLLEPTIQSISSLWKSAELFECEIFDLFGIRFLEHQNLRRLFMPNDWEGFPLRKDYDPNQVVI